MNTKIHKNLYSKWWIKGLLLPIFVSLIGGILVYLILPKDSSDHPTNGDIVEGDKNVIGGDYVAGDKNVIIESFDYDKLEPRFLKAAEELFTRLQSNGDIKVKDIQARAKKTFETLKNANANFLIQEGLKYQGTIATNLILYANISKKFYLLDIIGNLDKNRISVFYDHGMLRYILLSSDGTKYGMEVDTSSWVRGVPYGIICGYKANKNIILAVGKFWTDSMIKEYKSMSEKEQVSFKAMMEEDKILKEKETPDMNFDELGPLAFRNIDFEGKFPANLKLVGIGAPKKRVKDMGLSEVNDKQ